MAGKKGSDSSKKAAGQARKADAAASKAAAEQSKKDAVEDAEWSKGSKSSAKKEAEAAKKAEQARKKAEKDALAKEEEESLPARAVPKNSKTAVKKTRGLNLAQLDGDDDKASALNASGIDNALDALSLTNKTNDKIDRHPERRFKAAYAAFEERRLAEMDADGTAKGLRLNQRKERISKEFEKSPDNPFNQVAATYNASRDELAELREKERAKIEGRLAK